MKMVSLWVEHWWNLQRVRELNINYTHSFRCPRVSFRNLQTLLSSSLFPHHRYRACTPSVLNNNKLYLLHLHWGLLLVAAAAIAASATSCLHDFCCLQILSVLLNWAKSHAHFTQTAWCLYSDHENHVSNLLPHRIKKKVISLSLMEEFHLSVFCMYISAEAP